MAQQVVTELVIDGDPTGGADKFSQAMASAEQAANRGVESVTGFNVSLVAMGTGVVAAGVAVKGMLDYVVTANKGLADMQTVAHQVGLTLTDFQGVQFGGAVKGLDTTQINAGLEKSASLLNDASRNSNSLSKELEANGLSVKNANGQLITENQLLGIAANLIKNANNPGDQVAIAQMLGFTKEWIPLLEQGAGAMSGLAAEAKAAGAVIDDDIIQRATQFDTEWRKSSVELSSYMKAALVGLLPYVDDLIQGLQKFVKTIDTAKIEAAANDQLKTIADPLGIPDDLALKITIPQNVIDNWSALGDQVGKAYDELKGMSGDSGVMELLQFFKSTPAVAPAYNIGSHISNNIDKIKSAVGPYLPKVDSVEMPFATGGDPMAASGKATGPDNIDAVVKKWDAAQDAAQDSGDQRSIVASKDVGTDAVDRAINSLQKHTQAQIADAQAVGLGDAALAGFRATAAETAAVLANGGKETDAQAAKFAILRQAAIDAADALAKAKVASSIDFNSKTAFLSASDVAIAQQLKGIYGNDVPAALNSTYAAAIRVNNAFKEVSSAIDTNLTSGLTDIVSGTKSVSQGFSDMSASIVRAIEQMIIKLTIVQPLMQALQQAASGLGIGNISSLLGSGGVNANGSIAGAIGPTSVGGAPLVGYADGTDSAPGGWSIVGERGPERMYVPQGAQIVPNGRSANDNGGRASNIVINNHTDAQPQVSTGSNGDVTITLKKMIDGAVGDSLSSGTGMRVLSKQYGVNQFAGQ